MRSRGSSVGIATGCIASMVRFPTVQGVSFTTVFIQNQGATQPNIKCISVAFPFTSNLTIHLRLETRSRKTELYRLSPYFFMLGCLNKYKQGYICLNMTIYALFFKRRLKRQLLYPTVRALLRYYA
jgi:hypothetical protein